MKNKYIKIFFLVLILVVGYMFLAHTYIYHRIGWAHLNATDNKHVYNFVNNLPNTQPIVYVALGDSLTSGVGTDKYEDSFPYILSSYMAGKEKNIIHKNFSYPGARTQNIINDLLTPAITDQPNIVTLLIGTNDVHGFISYEDFEKNYDFILKELTSKTKAKIYVISIPKIGSRTLIFPPYNYYFDYKIDKYNKIINNLAQIYKVNYIDLTLPTNKLLKRNGKHYAKDSFHPSAFGYEIWAKIIYDNINK